MVVVGAIVVWGLAMVGFGLFCGVALGAPPAGGGGRAGPVLWAALAFLALGGAADMASAAFRSVLFLDTRSRG